MICKLLRHVLRRRRSSHLAPGCGRGNRRFACAMLATAAAAAAVSAATVLYVDFVRGKV
ncbi:hypothetical protein [Xylophilus sp. GOD-11R]|uniref:hypothetical protein n=1 Tax=Xylophilus sp. GOD-11R TaxID=3089814 RepID=UPI00298C6860|nr:hypothetical protein [Xylophilus sp. GOD-11R]WPB56932.1 hypothetical protein R9X41_22820 [Xylophilus sp. GOD-11R]